MIDSFLGAIDTSGAYQALDLAQQQIDMVVDYVNKFMDFFIPVVIWYGIFRTIIRKI